MKKNLFPCIVVLGFIFFSCESLQGALDSMEKSISDAAGNISGGGSGSAKYEPNTGLTTYRLCAIRRNFV